MQALLSIIVCLVGLVIYLIVKQNAEAKEIGRIMFFSGLIVALIQLGGQVVSLLGKSN